MFARITTKTTIWYARFAWTTIKCMYVLFCRDNHINNYGICKVCMENHKVGKVLFSKFKSVIIN